MSCKKAIFALKIIAYLRRNFYWPMEIRRDIYLGKLAKRKGNGMVKVITGMRRVGKSYLLFHLFADELRRKGVDNRHIVEVDLESLRNRELRDPVRLLDYVDRRIGDNSMHYLLFDEIQLVEGFEDVLNTYLKQSNTDVYATGSNAKLLSRDVATAFRGRGDEVRVRPLSFAEYLPAANGRSREAALADYMLYGGLPQTMAMAGDEQRKAYLASLLRDTYLLDIKQRYNITDDSDLEELINVVASAIGGLTNPLRLQNTFQTVKHSSISYATIKRYLDLLADAFMIEKAVRYDIRGRRYIDSPHKYYFEDLGIRNARLNFRQAEPTHLLENMVYNELRLRGYSVDVGQVVRNTKDGQGRSVRQPLEVDFVCNKGFDRVYVQCAWNLDGGDKREQELRPLRGIADGFPRIVVAGGMQPTYRDDDGIMTINIFDFLLGHTKV